MNRLKTKQQDQVLLKPGQEILLTIKRMGINGEGIGYYKKKAVFVPGAIVGEVVEVKIIKVERGYAEGSVKKIKTASPMRQTPSCPVYEQCGGCQLQHLTYEGQLKAKEEIFRGAFDRYTTIKDLPIRPILGMDEPWAYRNKAQLQVGMHDGKMVTGLYSPSSHRLVDVSGCPVQHPQTNQIIDITRQVLEKFGISVYDEKKRTGVIRTIIARIGFESGEQQLILVTATKDLAHRAEIVSELRSRLPDLSSISQNVNPKKTSLIFGDQTIHLWGSAHITEKLEQTSYSLSPRTFFQLNPVQTVKLYNVVKEAAALTGRELVIDAYCGVGTIALWLAPDAKEVRGIEIIPEAIEDAKNNAQQNGIDHAQFYVGKAEELLPKWVKEGHRPDVIVVDPPRTGCDPALLNAIIKAKPKRFVYVSCNPSTLAKDVAYLQKFYELSWVQPVDMFPHTSHVECVVGLYLREEV